MSLIRILGAAAIMASVFTAQTALAQDLAAGKKLYVDNCQRCHNDKGQGGIGKKLTGDAAYWDFAIFKRTVIEGIDDENKKMKIMPVFGKVGLFTPKGKVPDDADLHNIQAYLQTFGPAE
jgi:mono/diheme cytochrome c family protein